VTIAEVDRFIRSPCGRAQQRNGKVEVERIRGLDEHLNHQRFNFEIDSDRGRASSIRKVFAMSCEVARNDLSAFAPNIQVLSLAMPSMVAIA
jgi:hypothetical protein